MATANLSDPTTSISNSTTNKPSPLKDSAVPTNLPGNSKSSKPPAQPSQRKKTFTGCWTCRNRKVKCDLGRPQCNRCLKSKIKCEGYDIKLRWSTKGDKDNDEEYFQRRNIEFVVYPPEMTFKTYDEMDSTLSKLHSPLLVSDETKVLGPFGVFQGVKVVPKKGKANKRKRKGEIDSPSTTPSSFGPKRRSKGSGNNSSTSSPLVVPNSNNPASGRLSTEMTASTSGLSKDSVPPLSLTSTSSTSFTSPLGVEISTSHEDNIFSNPIDASSFPNFTNSQNSTLLPNNTTTHANSINTIIGTMEQNGESSLSRNNHNGLSSHSLTHMQIIEGLLTHKTQPGLDRIISQMHQSMPLPNINVDLNALSDQQSNTQNLDSSTTRNSASFNGVSLLNNDEESDFSNHQNVGGLDTIVGNSHHNSQVNFSNNLMEQQHGNNANTPMNININNLDAMVSNASIYGKPRNLNSFRGEYNLANDGNTNLGENPLSTQMFENNNNNTNSQQRRDSTDSDDDASLVMIPTASIISSFLSTDFSYGISTNSIYFSPEARHLLHHYIRHVARLMTVVTHESTPWKTIYLPRAINAIGCLTALGSTSPARNTVLHALLSVSAYHLASKYQSNSPQRQHFNNFGRRLKKHAVKYLSQCPNNPTFPVVDSEHKDLITAVLSMVSIGVVSGEMNSCYMYLKHCKKHITAQLRNPLTKNTKETQILHRIYAFLSLLQDSTNITPDRIDASVFDGPAWNTVREIEDLGLDSIGPNSSNIRQGPATSGINSIGDENSPSTMIFPNLMQDQLSNSNNSNGSDLSPNQQLINSIFDFKFLNDFGANPSITDISGMSQPDGNNSVPNNDLENPGHSRQGSRESSSLGNEFNQVSQPPKNFYDMEIISTYSMYGLPDSLTLLFNRVVRLARQKFFLESPKGQNHAELKDKFHNDCLQLDNMLVSWLDDFHETQIPPEFTKTTKKAFLLHTIAFYHSLCIYHYTIVRDIPAEKLQDKARLVLKYLEDMLQFNRNSSSPVIVPLLFPAFIAACETTEGNLAKQFDEWFDQICIDGLGTYFQARKVIKEVWRRRSLGSADCRWHQVLSDMGVCLLLS